MLPATETGSDTAHLSVLSSRLPGGRDDLQPDAPPLDDPPLDDPPPDVPRLDDRRRLDPCRGSVTAETAVLLPVLLVTLGACVGVLASVAAQLRCVDAARAAARVAARGDTAEVVREAGQRLAPPGAAVSIRPTGDTVEVLVTARVRPFGSALRVLPSVAVSGRAVAAVEGSPP